MQSSPILTGHRPLDTNREDRDTRKVRQRKPRQPNGPEDERKLLRTAMRQVIERNAASGHVAYPLRDKEEQLPPPADVWYISPPLEPRNTHHHSAQTH